MIGTRLDLDSKEINQPEGTYRDAWNILSTKSRNAKTNEDGFEITAVNYPASAIPMGTTPFPDGSYVVYSDGTTDRIGIVDLDNNYTDIIVDNILGFDVNFPILASEFDFNYLEQRIVSFTDANNVTRILNLDSLPFTLDGNKALVDPTQITNLSIFPEFKIPQLTFSVNQDGGSVRSGTYHISIAYESNDGTRTPVSIPYKTIYINDDSNTESFDQIDGAVADSLSGKSIALSFSNLDTRYDKLVLIITARNNGQITFKEIKKLDFFGSTLNTVYSGSETGTTLSEDEVLTRRPIYIKSKAMARLQDRLYHANLETKEEIDFQSYANNIRINYTSTLVNVLDINQSHKNNYSKGFPHGEAVAFYIGLFLRNGSLSRLFHIPGRAAVAGELGTSSLANAIDITAKKYQIEDTTNAIGATTNMGFWRNENELYPSGFPSLAGTNVRHHVFPSISKCKNLHYSANSLYGVTQFDVLGIDVSNVVIPSDIASQIEGWAIFYAKRDQSNSLNLGTDITQLTASIEGQPNVIWSTGGNWNINAVQAGSDGWKNLSLRFDYLRSHNFDLLKDKPSISPTYIDFELYLRKNNLNAFYSVYGKQGGFMTTSGKNNGRFSGAVIDYTDAVNTEAIKITGQTIRKITDYRYLPNNIKDGNLYNINCEETLLLNVTNFPTTLFDTLRTNSPNQTTPGSAILFNTGYEQCYLYSLKQHKTDVYINYNNQTPVMVDKIAVGATTSLSGIFGGDVFVNYRSFMTTAPQHGDDLGQDEYHGVGMIKAHISENKNNHGLRYEDIARATTKYYPKTSPTDIFLDPSVEGSSRFFVKRSENINEVAYNEDYSALNDLIATTIYHPSTILTNKFPYRVIRSGVAGTNPSSLNSWKTYLSNDYYEGNRNRGAIVNLAVLDDILLIHHKFGLFRTLSNERLNLGSTEVYLGSGDIFGKEPKEPISTKNGYLGTQNIFSCFNFHGGYVWADQNTGRVFILSSKGISEISNIGMYNYFRDNLKINNTLPDNPITGFGILASYDPKYNRILFTKKGTTSFTLSYSLDDNGWICFHNYTPDYLFSTGNNIFSFKNNKIYKHNIETKKGLYYDIIPYDSSITRIFNKGNRIDKLFFELEWITEVYNASNVLQRNETFNKLRLLTSYQDSGEIELIPFTSFGVNHNIRREKSTWKFNKLRDFNNDVFKKKELIDKYLSVKFSFENTIQLDNSQNLLYLYDLAVKYTTP